ncbi:MAG: putative viral replication protein [Circoviridae sp.]|nr:MAG: putative viral replication protein [Circoviridae sp.]
MPVQATRALNWTFTLANYDDSDRRSISGFFDQGSCGYLVYQRELSESGLHHLQGYLELKKPVSLRTLKRKLGLPTLHLEIVRNPDAARSYCIKEATRLDGTEPTEFGTYKVRRPGGFPSFRWI